VKKTVHVNGAKATRKAEQVIGCDVLRAQCDDREPRESCFNLSELRRILEVRIKYLGTKAAGEGDNLHGLLL
jgi:hypothetical protein